MPNQKRKQRVQQRELQQQVEEIEQLRSQLVARSGHAAAPNSRPATAQWDWNCGCGVFTFAGRTRCYNVRCNRLRFDGVTISGSVRGQLQTSIAAVDAHAKQILVLG